LPKVKRDEPSGLKRQSRSRVVKIGAKVVRHGRHVTFQLAEVQYRETYSGKS